MASKEPIPRAKDNLHLDHAEFANLRWQWGERNIPDDELLEGGISDRDPLLEAYEEGVDMSNYFKHHIKTRQVGEITVMLHELSYMLERLRALCMKES